MHHEKKQNSEEISSKSWMS